MFCLAATFAGMAWAIDPNRAMSQYLRERWGPEQGLPRGPVYAIAQSDDGYLWIGTQAGLVRFDGMNFSLVRDAPGLRHGEGVLGLMGDRDGNLWIRLDGAVLLRYRNGVFDRPVSAASLNARITAVSRANQGELLISLMERGTMISRHGAFEMIVDVGALPRSPVLSVAQTADGSIWAGTRGAGLFRVREGHVSAVTENLPDLKVNCLVSGSRRGSVGRYGRRHRALGREQTHCGRNAIARWNPGSGDGEGSRWEHLGRHGLSRPPAPQRSRRFSAGHARRRAA